MKKCFLSIIMSIGLLTSDISAFGFRQSSLDTYAIGQFSLISLFAYCHANDFFGNYIKNLYEKSYLYKMSTPAKWSYATIIGLLSTYPIHWIMKRWSYESKLHNAIKELISIKLNNAIVTLDYNESENKILDIIKSKYYESSIWLYAAQKELTDLRNKVSIILNTISPLREKFSHDSKLLTLCDTVIQDGRKYITNITYALNIINNKCTQQS